MEQHHTTPRIFFLSAGITCYIKRNLFIEIRAMDLLKVFLDIIDEANPKVVYVVDYISEFHLSLLVTVRPSSN